MKYIWLVILIYCRAFSTYSDQVDTVKKKWRDWANQNVDREKEAFLKKYSIDPAKLQNAKLHQDLRLSHDQMAQEMVDSYIEENGKNISDEAEFVLQIAKNIFPSHLRIKILSDVNLPHNQIGVVQSYSTNECFIVVNSVEHSNDLSRLKELLLHELSHIIHEDNFHKELIQCLAWVNSQENHEQIEEASYPFCHAFEIRADIHAALHSPDHGKHLIAFLKKEEKCPSHPNPSERIALLKKIRKDLFLR